MHPYIPHLLSDIAGAHCADMPEPMYPKTIQEEFDEIERWVESEEPPHTFGCYCGLNNEQFPPAEQLTKKEIKIICKAFRQMMFSWNLGADLPKKLPAELYYSFLINTLNMKTNIVSSGFMTFEFCCSYPPDCPFKEHCMCLKFWNTEETFIPPTETDELPF
ncbi:MAG: hypothetical protein ABJA79_08290 [Parafilimonas sp.]